MLYFGLTTPLRCSRLNPNPNPHLVFNGFRSTLSYCDPECFNNDKLLVLVPRMLMILYIITLDKLTLYANDSVYTAMHGFEVCYVKTYGNATIEI